MINYNSSLIIKIIFTKFWTHTQRSHCENAISYTSLHSDYHLKYDNSERGSSMIYKYYVLNIEIINFDYIDEEWSEVELDNATGLGNFLQDDWPGSITRLALCWV